MVSKARKAARDRAVSPSSRKGGRPHGALPLQKDARRFEVALYHMLVQTRLRGRPTHAAEFAASVLHDRIVLTVLKGRLSFQFTGGHGEKIVRWSTKGTIVSYDPTERGNARANRRDKILREAPGLIASATGHDRVWSEISARLLHGLFNAFAGGDADAIQQLLTLLAQRGWEKPLCNLFPAKVTSENQVGPIVY